MVSTHGRMPRGGTARSCLAPGIFALLAFLARPKRLEEVEEHPTRREILAVVRDNPGIPLNKLRGRIPVAWGTLYHHVWRLVKEGGLETAVMGRRRLLFLPGAGSAELLQARGLLEGATARAIAREILAHPRVSFKDLVPMTGESERVVYHHLKRLLDAGLVESTSKTRHYGLTPAPRLALYLNQIEHEQE